jgi:hypothetical protein
MAPVKPRRSVGQALADGVAQSSPVMLVPGVATEEILPARSDAATQAAVAGSTAITAAVGLL